MPEIYSIRRGTMLQDPSEVDYIALYTLHKWMKDVAYPVAYGVLFDYGCGGQPYRSLFEERVERYIGGDVEKRDDVDIHLEPNKPVPLPDSSVDIVLSNQVLEHVAEPSFYLMECKRLLKDGGMLILTAPMQWRLHETPNDYYRYTKHGLQYKLGKAGLEVVEMQCCGGAFAMAGQAIMNSLYGQRRMRRPLFRRLFNRLFLWLDKRYADDGDTLNWNCLARKPFPGENRGGLEGFSLFEKLGQIEFGPVEKGNEYCNPSLLRSVNVAGQTRDALQQHPAPGGMKNEFLFPLIPIGQNQKLSFGISLHPDVMKKNLGARGGVVFAIDIVHEGCRENIFTASIDPKANRKDRRWHDHVLSLERYAQKKIDIILHTQPAAGKNNAFTASLWSGLNVG